MAKRDLHRTFFIISPRGNIRYSFYRSTINKNNKSDLAYIIIARYQGKTGDRKFIYGHDMNEVMRGSIMKNFRQWCVRYLLLCKDFDPSTDKIDEL